MKSLLTLSFTLFLLAACGGKKAQTSFSLNAGALLNGSNPLGGAVITGSNGTDKFSVGLNASQVSNFSIDLPQGNWNFYAVAWFDDLGQGAMSGKTRCGISQAQIQGSNVSIELSLTNENCAAGVFGPVSTKDTTTYAGETAFKRVYLNSCNNPVGYPALCDSSTIEAIPGESVSFQFVIPGYSSFGANPSSLSSVCLNPFVHNQGLFYSEVRLPLVNNLGPIPVLLKGYEKRNCIDPDATYNFSGDIAGFSAVDRSVTANTPTYYTLTFPDNYVGKTGSPFIDAHNLGKIKLPIMNCGGTCYSTSNKSVDYSFAKDEVREGVWSLFGTNDGRDSYNFSPSAQAFLSIFNAMGGQIDLTADSSLGSKGNNIRLNVVSTGASGNTATATCNSANRTIAIFAKDDVMPVNVATAVNASCAGFISASIANGSAGQFSAGTFWFSGGADTFNNQGRRQEGSITDLKHILFGAIGAVLYTNNIQTWTQLCSANGSYSYQLPNDSLTISLSTPSASAIHPRFAANNSATYERKLVFNINGQNEEALFFNCLHGDASNEDYAVGTYISYKNDDRLEYVQTSWDVTTTNAEWFERSIQQTESGNTIWRYDLFYHSGTADNWSYWAMAGSTQFNSYRRVAATAAAGSIFASAYDTGSSTDTITAFLTGGQIEWSLSSGAYISNSVNNTSEPSTINASVTNPRTYPSYSMNDMINNAVFWNFSY